MITYRGYDIFKSDDNTSGIKYYTRTHNGILRADTLDGIKRLIQKIYQGSGVFGNEI